MTQSTSGCTFTMLNMLLGFRAITTLSHATQEGIVTYLRHQYPSTSAVEAYVS